MSVVVGKFDLQLITAGGLGDRGFLQQLPRRYHEMSRGDYSWLAREVIQARRAWIGNAMSYCMDCASGASPERMARVEDEAGEALLADVIDLPFPYVSAAWGVPDLGLRVPLSHNDRCASPLHERNARWPDTVEQRRGNSPGILYERAHCHSARDTQQLQTGRLSPSIRATLASFLRGEMIARSRDQRSL